VGCEIDALPLGAESHRAREARLMNGEAAIWLYTNEIDYA